MQTFLFRFFKNESAATAIEYTIIVAGIAVAIVTAVSTLGTAVSAKFDYIKSNMQ